MAIILIAKERIKVKTSHFTAVVKAVVLDIQNEKQTAGNHFIQ